MLVEAELKKRGITCGGEENNNECLGSMLAVEDDEAEVMDGDPAATMPLVE